MTLPPQLPDPPPDRPVIHCDRGGPRWAIALLLGGLWVLLWASPALGH